MRGLRVALALGLLATAGASRGDVSRLYEGIAAMLSHGDDAPVADWIAFAEGLDRRAIDAALHSHEFTAWTLGGGRAAASKERS